MTTAPPLVRLRRVLLTAPIVMWLALEAAHHLLAARLTPWMQLVIGGAVLLPVVALLYDRAMVAMDRVGRRLRRQNDELLALHRAGLAVSADLALESVLQTIVERACELLRARYGALAVLGGDGRVEAFVTWGVDDATRERIGPPPSCRGLLGVPLRAGERLRLDDLATDPRSAGFPSGHPPMRTLLAVPVLSRGGPRGNLYLSEKEHGAPFDAEDEETLVRFAQQAAIAIDNARLHRDAHELAAARERLRLAAATYDGLAQVLAYVNTKSQVVREHCKQGRHADAMRHLDQLAAAAREVYAEQRARLLDLRSLQDGTDPTTTAQAIAHHVRAWEAETEMPVELRLPEILEAPPEVELQLLRIIQEGLENVRRHAHANSVRLLLEHRGPELHLEIADDGVGFDVAAPPSGNGAPHLGLAAMRERAAAVGGELHLSAAPGAGTLLTLDVPATREAQHAAADR